MGAQKQEKMLTEILGIFECLLTENLTNQDSQFSWLFQTLWKTVRKSKNMESRELFLPENDFKTCSKVNCRKWLKNRNLWFLEFYFYFEVHIQQWWYLTGGNSSWSVIRRRKTQHFKIKKPIQAAQKCKIILLQAALKDFWSSANLKLKKIKFVKTLTSLGLYYITIKMQEWGFLGVIFVYKLFKILLQWVFRKKLNFEGLQTYQRHKNVIIS